MQEESPSHPLIKQVQGHLFTFEEKIFGMSLQHLLIDLGVMTGSFSLTGALHLLPRVLVCVLITGCALVGIHGKMQGVSFGYWLYLWIRSKMIPRRTVWRSSQEMKEQPGHTGFPSVQATWIPIETLQQGIGEKSDQRKKVKTGRYWMAFEVEGKNIQLFPEHEQVRVFHRFESFLTGLAFHLQLLSLTEQIDPQTAPSLLRQKEALTTLAATPRLQALQQASLTAQQEQITTCSRTRHFLIVSVSSMEAALQNPESSSPSVLSTVLRLLAFKKTPAVPRTQVLDHLRIRAALVRKAMQHLDMRIWPLQDQELLPLLAQCLAPGSRVPTFMPELMERQTVPPLQARKQQGGSRQQTRPPGPQARHVMSSTTPSLSLPISPHQSEEPFRPRERTRTPQTSSYKKRLSGVHGTFYYTSHQQQARLEPDLLAVADLLAPSSIEVYPDLLVIQAGKQTRYVQTLTVTGYGYHLLCGWMTTLHDLGLPVLVSTHLEPIESRLMIMKLEQALTKLESKRLSDQKTLRITKADQTIEAEQIRLVLHALAAKKLKIFAVSMTITVQAGSRERLEQRSRYLLSHLRDIQLHARPAIRQQDLAWQSCLPVGLDLLQNWVKLTSDVVSTMLPGTSGILGTPTGVFLGYAGNGLARRPVYLDLWALPNPHVVVIGDTGQGKSWVAKLLVTGLMGLGQADVCVLDKDDDYLELHTELHGESQRYDLARGCPLNPFDIPFGPRDVNPNDPADLLAEFFDNGLMTALALLVTDEDTRLSKGEEAYLMTVARATYATKGITMEKIRQNPETLLLPAPILADFLAQIQGMPASSESMRQSLRERFEKAAYLFQGPTSISLEKPLTIFSIKDLDEKWFALMTYVVQNFLLRHRAIKHEKRYLAYVVEEASYLLRHAAGRRYLERGSRGFRKLGIAQITLSQHPRDFLEAGQVVLSNAGTVFYLGMERTAVEKLHLAEELERVLLEGLPGHCVLRVGNEYTPLTVWSHPVYRALFTTDPAERRAMRKRQEPHQQSAPHARVQEEQGEQA